MSLQYVKIKSNNNIMVYYYYIIIGANAHPILIKLPLVENFSTDTFV